MASVIVAMLVLGAIAASLLQYREEVKARALLTAEALRASAEMQLRRQLESYDAALKLVIADFSDPTLRMLDDNLWQLLLSNIQSSAPAIRSITIANAGGRVLSQQGPAVTDDFGASSFFKAHQARADLGLLIGDPTMDEHGRLFVVLSRSIVRSDGAFGGVVAVVIDLSVVRQIIEPMPLGPHDVINVVSLSGLVVSRKAAAGGADDAGIDVSKNSNFLRMHQMRQGSFSSRSVLDGVERLFSFSTLEQMKLIVVVGLGTDALYGNWRRQSALIGGLALIVSLALIVAAVLLVKEARLRSSVQGELEKQARTDFLTGLPNRRQFEASLDREWRRAVRTGADLAVVMFDADHFKRLNDEHGHAVGDEMLKLIATVLDGCARRPGDLPARIGGEEFAMLLADTGSAGAARVADHVRSALKQKLVADGGIATVTLSGGIAAKTKGSAGSAADLLAAADEALYRAKEEGRDQVKVHDEL